MNTTTKQQTSRGQTIRTHSNEPDTFSDELFRAMNRDPLELPRNIDDRRAPAFRTWRTYPRSAPRRKHSTKDTR